MSVKLNNGKNPDKNQERQYGVLEGEIGLKQDSYK